MSPQQKKRVWPHQGDHVSNTGKLQRIRNSCSSSKIEQTQVQLLFVLWLNPQSPSLGQEGESCQNDRAQQRLTPRSTKVTRHLTFLPREELPPRGDSSHSPSITFFRDTRLKSLFHCHSQHAHGRNSRGESRTAIHLRPDEQTAHRLLEPPGSNTWPAGSLSPEPTFGRQQKVAC